MQLTTVGEVERKSFADMDCSVAQCLEVVGEWWSMLIVRDVFLGVSRFDDFQTAPRDLPQHPPAAPGPTRRRRRPAPGAVLRAPAPPSTTGSPTKGATCGPCSPPCGSGGTATRLRRGRPSRSPTRRAGRRRKRSWCAVRAASPSDRGTSKPGNAGAITDPRVPYGPVRRPARRAGRPWSPGSAISHSDWLTTYRGRLPRVVTPGPSEPHSESAPARPGRRFRRGVLLLGRKRRRSRRRDRPVGGLLERGRCGSSPDSEPAQRVPLGVVTGDAARSRILGPSARSPFRPKVGSDKIGVVAVDPHSRPSAAPPTD